MINIRRALIHVVALIMLCAAPILAASVTLSWDASGDPSVTGYKIHFGSASGAYGTHLNAGNQISCTMADFSSGTYFFAVTAYNSSGQESGYSNEVSTTVVTPDTTPPTVALLSPASSGSFDATSPSISIAGTATDNMGVAQVTWANNRGGSGLATGTSSWSATGVPLQMGANLIAVTAIDTAGNTAAASLTVTYAPDTIAPTVTIGSPISSGSFNTSSSSVSIAGIASDNVGVTQVTWSNNRGGNGAATGTTSWNIRGVSLQSGSNIITVSVQDAAGNAATTSLTINSDPVVPTLAITSPASSGTFSTSSASISISGTASDNVGLTQVTWSSNRGGNGVATGTTSWNISGVSLQTGSNIIAVSAQDAVGNKATASVTINYTLTDQSPPLISGLKAAQLSKSSFRIDWITNEPSTSQVEYGSTSVYSRATSLDSNLVTVHSQTISGLNSRTKYHYRVRSRDSAGNLAVSADATFSIGRSNSSAYPRIFSPAIRSAGANDNEHFGLALTNGNSVSANVTFTAYDAEGKLILAEGIKNPVSMQLNPGQQFPIIDAGLFGRLPLDSGSWIQLESDVEGVAGIFLIFDERLTSLEGSTLLAAPTADFVLPEIPENGLVRFNIANPNNCTANLEIDLVKEDGSVRASTSRAVPANGSASGITFEDWFPGQFPAATDYVRARSDIGVLPFEQIMKEGQDASMVPGLERSEGSQILYSPQYAVGGIWKSALSIVNLSPVPGSVRIGLFADNGSPIGTVRDLEIAANGKIRVDDDRFFKSGAGGVVQGYVQIVANGIQLNGSITFGGAGNMSFATSLPLVASLKDSFLFGQLASNDLFFTGIALLNPDDKDAAARIELYSADGKLEAAKQVEIKSRQRITGLLTEFFSDLVGQDRTSGYIRVRSDGGLAGFALFGTHSMSVLSSIPQQDMPQFNHRGEALSR